MSEETKKTEEQVAPEVQATEVTTEATETTEKVIENANPDLATFDWHKYEEGIEAVDQEKLDA
ncbi:MAG: hypothetical protein JKY08_01730, partial [Flavobacteriaceae bacterium]|nr:hypothetical protein [Flavobacteriaceae bacterium]